MTVAVMMSIMKGPIRLFQRLSSTTTFTADSTSSKSHLHAPILPQKGYFVGIHAGVKTIYPNQPNPPLDLAINILDKSNGHACAVAVNSGCANVVTGKKGIKDAWSIVRVEVAFLRAYGLPLLDGKEPTTTIRTLVMSTGIIGVSFPITAIASTLHTPLDPSPPICALVSTLTVWDAAARASMTTNTFPELCARTFQINDSMYRMAGMDKGAGMNHPRMATLQSLPTTSFFGLILTDALVSPQNLRSVLHHAVDRTFNSISVDDDMSTNDTTTEGPEDGLTTFAIDLPKLVMRNGEGAAKFVEVSVEGPVPSSAHSAALNTPLDPPSVSVSFIPSLPENVPSTLLSAGDGEAHTSEILVQHNFGIVVDLGGQGVGGKDGARYWTCDFAI
ncbi:arginine biosynthesis bifunctional protein ARG7 [Pisolithus marmoratus]|nr:arginine biosynthesis bifunctional protein ARG7 [Pisolithus marmoratus]